MSKMVEKVAIAIAEASADTLDPIPLYMCDGYARAAIEAMRQATDDQRNAYFKMMKETGRSDLGACFMDADWERMIDAALS